MKIIQIIPADGWFAVFKRDKYKWPLTCWALIENEGGERFVSGITHGKEATDFICGLEEGFVCYKKGR